MRSTADMRLSTGTDTVERGRWSRVAHFVTGKKNIIIKIQDMGNSYCDRDVNDLGVAFYLHLAM
jgi:hypothetical protein